MLTLTLGFEKCTFEQHNRQLDLTLCNFKIAVFKKMVMKVMTQKITSNISANYLSTSLHINVISLAMATIYTSIRGGNLSAHAAIPYAT